MKSRKNNRLHKRNMKAEIPGHYENGVKITEQARLLWDSLSSGGVILLQSKEEFTTGRIISRNEQIARVKTMNGYRIVNFAELVTGEIKIKQLREEIGA